MTEYNGVTPELLNKIDTVQKGCLDLHLPPPPVSFVTLDVFDKNGEQIHRHHEKTHSWVRNYYNLICSIILGNSNNATTGTPGAGELIIRNVSGANHRQTSVTGSLTFGGFAPTSGTSVSNAQGIAIGNGTAPETLDSYILSAVLSTSVTATIHALIGPTYNSSTKTWTTTVVRSFTNSGATRNITETSLAYNFMLSSSGSNAYNFLMDRTLLTVPVEFPTASTVQVKYTISMVFPE